MNKIIENVKKHIEKTEKFTFSSRSLENSKMDWNNNGNGKIVEKKIFGKKIIEGKTIEKKILKKEINEEKIDENKIEISEVYFFEEIDLENGMKLKDKKMWKFEENKISFFHFRNNEYEKIFSFIVENEEISMEKEYECKPDFYFGKLKIENEKLFFEINIVGKRKNEKIEYIYV